MKLYLLLALAIGALALYGSKSDVVSLDAKSFKEQVINSDGDWFVEFYAPWCGHCKQLAPEWEKAAKALKGVIKVGAVDMDAHKEVGGPYNVKGFPTIKWFGADKKKPDDYQSGRDASSITDFALNQAKKAVKDRLSGKKSSSDSKSKTKSDTGGSKKAGGSGGSDVVVLTADNFKETVLESKDIWLVEFYAPWCGHCKKLAPEWEQAATQLKGQVKVGKVDATEEQQLAQQYGISGYPTIKYWEYGAGKKKSNVKDYQSGRTASDIVNFAQKLLKDADIEPEVHELLSHKLFEEHCTDGACVLSFLPNLFATSASERNDNIDTIKKTAKKFLGHPFKFLWIEGGDHPEVEQTLNLGFGFPAVVVVNTNKNIFGTMNGAFSKDGISSYLEGILSGRHRMQELPGKLKFNDAEKWDGKDPVFEEEEEWDLSDVVLEDL